MNFIDAFYDVVPGTVINFERKNGCSLERTLKTSTTLMSNPVFVPPGCSIGLNFENIFGTFSYYRNIGVC